MTAPARASGNRYVTPRKRVAPVTKPHECSGEESSEYSGVTARDRLQARLQSVWGTLGAALLVLGSATSVAWGVYHYATNSPRFAIRNIAITGNSRVTREQVLNGAGITMGGNLFQTQLPGVENRLLKNPWISEVRVARLLPATIQIEVHEREAAALALVAGRLLLVNRQGESFKEFTAGDPGDLPLITGATLEEDPNDVGLLRQRIARGLDVLTAYSQSRLSKAYGAQEVHLTPGSEAVITLGHKAITLHLGAGPWPKKFEMAERIVARLQAQHASASVIFLDNRANPNRVVVRVN